VASDRIFLSLRGLFFEREGELQILQEGLLSRIHLEDFKDAQVRVLLGHLPLNNPDPGLPGLGSCMWNGHCPHGHVADPLKMFYQSEEGVLKRSSEGIWLVGGSPLQLEKLVGHTGLIVCLSLSQDTSLRPEVLLGKLSTVLGDLRRMADAFGG